MGHSSPAFTTLPTSGRRNHTFVGAAHLCRRRLAARPCSGHGRMTECRQGRDPADDFSCAGLWRTACEQASYHLAAIGHNRPHPNIGLSLSFFGRTLQPRATL